MARIRTIKPGFFTSEDVCACHPLARLLFIGLWGEADKSGRLHDKPAQLKFRLLPADDVDVDTLLWELHDAGLVKRKESGDGLRIIQIVKFEDHQKPHPKEPESTLPADCRERSRPAVEKNGRVVMHPVENPSTTARKGREQEQEQIQLGKGMEGGANGGSGSLIVSPMEFEKLQRFNAFVGSRLRVPHKLHHDFVAALGGAEPESVLRTWYAEVNAEIEASGEPILPDVWKFMEARFKPWVSNRQFDLEMAKLGKGA